MLLPLAVGKAASSVSSLAWLHLRPGLSALRINALVDGAIAVLALAIYLSARRRGQCG